MIQLMTVYESESEVAQSCPTLCDSMDCRLPASSTHGIFQARVLEWVVIAFSTVGLQARPKDTVWEIYSSKVGNSQISWTSVTTS